MISVQDPDGSWWPADPAKRRYLARARREAGRKMERQREERAALLASLSGAVIESIEVIEPDWEDGTEYVLHLQDGREVSL